MTKFFKSAVNISKYIMDNYVKEGHIALDCTLGNGNDTLHLAKLVGDEGKVYGFDIQSQALEITKAKLEANNLEERVTLIHDSHEYIDKYVHKPFDIAVYNLGYLPGGDKTIITKPESTIKSLKQAIRLLKNSGIILITCYTGHKGGKEEKEVVESFLSDLDQKYINVLEFNFINQINNPPVLYGVEKIKQEG